MPEQKENKNGLQDFRERRQRESTGQDSLEDSQQLPLTMVTNKIWEQQLYHIF